MDLAPIQPSNRPQNCIFHSPFDIESPWLLGENSWDVIRLQMGHGCVSNWHSLYHKVHGHFRDSAWFEQVEIDFEPKCENNKLNNYSALHFWYQTLAQAAEGIGRPLAHCPRRTIDLLQESGFIDIKHEQIGLPLSQWHDDDHERVVGRWYSHAFQDTVDRLSIVYLGHVLGWAQDQIQQIVARVKPEGSNDDIHVFNVLHLYQARKRPA